MFLVKNAIKVLNTNHFTSNNSPSNNSFSGRKIKKALPKREDF